MHFTPTYSPWLNQVERWFGLLTDKKLRRGTRRLIYALEKDIRDWIGNWNATPNHSPGSNPPMRASNASTYIFNEFLAQDTRSLVIKSDPAAPPSSNEATPDPHWSCPGT